MCWNNYIYINKNNLPKCSYVGTSTDRGLSINSTNFFVLFLILYILKKKARREAALESLLNSSLDKM